jgi:hypothetical protein
MVEGLHLHGMSFRNQCRYRFSTCSYPCQVHISGGLHTESLTWIHVVNPQRWDPSCATVRRSPVPFAVVTRVSFGLQVKWFSGSSHFETNFESCSQYVWAAQLIKSSAPTVDAMRLTCLTHSALSHQLAWFGPRNESEQSTHVRKIFEKPGYGNRSAESEYHVMSNLVPMCSRRSVRRTGLLTDRILRYYARRSRSIPSTSTLF